MIRSFVYHGLMRLLFVICITGCREEHKLKKATVVHEKVYDSIPSGSGMEVFKDSLFIVGDDAVAIYQLSLKDQRFRKYTTLSAIKSDRFEREEKPDYESATRLSYRGGNYLLAFGSGSKSPQRDSLLIVDLDRGKIDTVICIRRFYDHLLQLMNAKPGQLNMEGAAMMADRLILMDRANNHVFAFNAERFIQHLLVKEQMPPIHHFKVNLPAIGAYEARVSGAAASGNNLYFSASVEQTNDWTKDGPVAGSFIGSMDEKEESINWSAKVLYPNGKIALDKIESLVFLRENNNGNATFMAIADNDDGKTKLMEISVSASY